MDTPVPAEQVQFQFAAETATLLLQSLRRDDAREMTALLQGYIEQHFGTPRDQLVLLHDPRGPLLVPASAQPFAQLNERFRQWLEQSAPRAAAGASPTIPRAEAVAAEPVEEIVDAAPAAPEALRVTTLHRTFAELRSVARPWLTGTSIVWVDDNPGDNLELAEMFRDLGATVNRTTDSWVAIGRIEPTDIVITDMARRHEGPEAGLELVRSLRGWTPHTPVIIFSRSGYDRLALARSRKGLSGAPTMGAS
jgi:CheY-like chemotaxis protein